MKKFKRWIDGYFGYKNRMQYKIASVIEQNSRLSRETTEARITHTNQVRVNFEMLNECRKFQSENEELKRKLNTMYNCKEDYERFLKQMARVTEPFCMRMKPRILESINFYNALIRK